MPPIIGGIIAFVGAAATAIGSVLGAIAAWAPFGIALGRVLLTVGLNLLMNALLAPKQSVAERQAQTLDLSLGETPRMAIFGRAAVGGTLLDGWNDGSDPSITNLFETMVIRLADHECEAIDGYYVNDVYYALTNQGAQNYPDLLDTKNQVRLWIEYRLGVPGQTLCSIIANQGVAAGEFLATDTFAGMTYVVARYEIGGKSWKSGRPRFTWVVRGMKCYDPRLDSTVAGGAGAQRWGTPTTYAWSENARVCHYNYMRGVWNYAATPAQLMVGPGRSAEEALPELVIADANLCDEAVTLKAGGTEPRYRCSAVIAADEKWIDVEDNFAACMAGQLVERGGTIGVDPGAAKSIAFTFTDDQLLAGKELIYQAKVGRDKLVNTVVARYVDPTQLWSQASAAMRRSDTDIATDGEAREQTLDLHFVTSETQAQRCGEIARRKARLQASAVVQLGPAYMQVEDGDWGTWTSARRFGGGSRNFEAQGVALDDTGNIGLPLKEISSSIFTWDPNVDELDKLAPAFLPAGAPEAASITNFAATPYEISSGGVSSGGIMATWDEIADPTIVSVQIDYRPKGSLTASSVLADPTTGSKLIDVLALVNVDYEARATPVCSPPRDTLTTAWVDVLLSVPFMPPIPPAHFQGYQTGGDLIRFTWDQTLDTTLQYEIRVGATFALGRFVARVYGGAVNVSWPILTGDDLTFWIKTLHSSGVYSLDAAFWVAVTNTPNANIVVAQDFAAGHFVGVKHRMTDTLIGATISLTSTASGPQIRSPSGLSINGAVYSVVRARARRISGAAWDGTVFYVTGGHGESGSFFKTIAEPAGWASGAWCDLEWNMAVLDVGGSDWIASTITQFRIDFTQDHPSAAEIEYVDVINPAGGTATVRYDFNADAQSWTATNATISHTNGTPEVLALDQISVGKSVMRGDYYSAFSLGATFTARTWIETTALEFANNVAVDPQGLAVLDAFISVNEALPADMLEGYTFNSTTTGAKTGKTPTTATGVAYRDGRAAQGATVGTVLAYTQNVGPNLSVMIDARLGVKPAANQRLVQFYNGTNQIEILYRIEKDWFVLRGDFAPDCIFDIPWEQGDTLSMGIWQTTAARGATLASKRHATPISAQTPLI